MNEKLKDIETKILKEYDSLVVRYFEMLEGFEIDVEPDKIIFSAHSCGIEGSTFTITETQLLSEDPYRTKTNNKSFFEIVEMIDHFNAFKWTYENKDKDLDEPFIQELHREVTKRTYEYTTKRSFLRMGKNETKVLSPGQYRTYNVRVGETIFMDYSKVGNAVSKMIEEFRNFPYKHPLVKSNFIHTQTAKIHPFADGNGRTARLLLNKVLWENNIPTLFVYKENKKDYINAIKSSNKENINTPMLLFLKEMFKKQVKNILIQKKKDNYL